MMFSSIQNILGIQPRHAEQNDTRQDIQRHDPEFERRKRKKQKDDDDLFNQEEGATLAISALSAFLEKFLKELSEKTPQKSFNQTSPIENEDADAPIKEDQSKEISGSAAYATNAYEHMAQSQQRTSILGEINEKNADLISMDAAEIRTIHALLDDLKILSEKNIEYIKIERAENFLQSLVNAVNTIKQSDLFKR